MALALQTPQLNVETCRAGAASLQKSTSGILGIAISDGTRRYTSHPGERFSLQSVMKLMVAAAYYDAVDKGRRKLIEGIWITRKDLSIGVQPISEKLGPKGYLAPASELIALTVQQSDSAAADILARHLGGINKIQAFLDAKGFRGMRIDRLERDLQSETNGLRFRPDYVDFDSFDKARNRLPNAKRNQAWAKYRKDPRDTTTTAAMCDFLEKLASGKLLSKASTESLLEVMRGTTTFPDRLAAGVPKPWKFGHKTGSSGTWQRITVATNDVGIAHHPDGRYLVIVALLKDSKGSETQRNRAIADVSRLAFAALKK